MYSRGLPQYFISDILPEDVVMKVGQEEKKLLLFDDFKCIDEGCIVFYDKRGMGTFDFRAFVSRS